MFCDDAFESKTQEEAGSPSSQVHFTKKEPCVFKATVAKPFIIVTMKEMINEAMHIQDQASFQFTLCPAS